MSLAAVAGGREWGTRWEPKKLTKQEMMGLDLR